MLIGLVVIDCCEGRRAVKFILSFEVSSRSYEEYSSGSAVHSRSSRVDSRMYEALRTGEEISGEDFQNTETFIVVRSSVFSKSSAQKTHFARDAHDAFLRWAGRRQDLFFQYSIFQCSSTRYQDPKTRSQNSFCQTSFWKFLSTSKDLDRHFFTVLFLKIFSEQRCLVFISANEKRLRAICPESFQMRVPKRGFEPPRPLRTLEPESRDSIVQGHFNYTVIVLTTKRYIYFML